LITYLVSASRNKNIAGKQAYNAILFHA